MAWQRLSKRIDKLPLVLAGPMVRRAEPANVTVWIALQSARTVTLRVFDADLNTVLIGTRRTVTLGAFLHVVAVTASSSPGSTDQLAPGNVYCYDLYFSPDNLTASEHVPIDSSQRLDSAGIISIVGGRPTAILIDGTSSPSFVLPPDDLNQLRLIHGSCRKPHGEGKDPFEALASKMIYDTVSDPFRRPHQLFLTGDQIYADDVADVLLAVLTEAGDTLLGWSEKLPDTAAGNDVATSQLLAGKRGPLIRTECGFTSGATKSHLMGLGEFYAMYLFTWSDILWPPALPDLGEAPFIGTTPKYEKGFTKEREAVELYLRGVKGVRQALANIPSYMMFDDHEITDDWYLSREFCNSVLSKPWGKRVIQNGLLAYAVFQAWGNTPDRFEPGSKGRTLLDAAEKWRGEIDDNETAIREGVGVPANPPLTAPELEHPEPAVDWHYTLVWPRYRVIALDPRTRRSYPGDKDPAELLSATAIKAQILTLPVAESEEVAIVIAPAPVVGVGFIEALPALASTFGDPYSLDAESWSLQPHGFESLLAALACRTTARQGQLRRSRVVFLSGDVHYACVARLRYWATRPLDDPIPTTTSTDAVFAQLTASAFHNEDSKTRKVHVAGFRPTQIEFPGLPEETEYLGWSNPSGQSLQIATIDTGMSEASISTNASPAIFALTETNNLLLNGTPPMSVKSIDVPPEWQYRVKFIRSTSDVDRGVAITPTDDRQVALKKYLETSKGHETIRRFLGCGQQIVGKCNIGEVTFHWGIDDDKSVTQEFWWHLPGQENPAPLSKMVVSLAFEGEMPPSP